MSEQNTLTPETEQAAGNETGNGPVDPAVASGIPGVMASLQAAAAGSPDLERILDIPVQLSVEIGRARTTISNVLQLSPGSVVELEAQAGAPMDVLINGYLIAQGEVVVVNDRFGIRLTDIVTPAERMRRLNRG
ncbi:MAG: flagellar motor switch protein FliN [Lautropia sp.]|jgi:flagellar motor switch protein fliN|uniref:Flagellar motor switch protein FliN n=1 Tax=Lautropia dentalis TaxID=2490857 RepID=A0A3R8LSC7_9BURK|nr:flagellar motor switch protein FliN [Lautropia dentalis]RKW39389.1 MAG: flagellar motor switch protein FliN [Lautropia sp.]RRN45140.1 flagellar motor switch protein FliN [Lautropia dentalis]